MRASALPPLVKAQLYIRIRSSRWPGRILRQRRLSPNFEPQSRRQPEAEPITHEARATTENRLPARPKQCGCSIEWDGLSGNARLKWKPRTEAAPSTNRHGRAL